MTPRDHDIRSARSNRRSRLRLGALALATAAGLAPLGCGSGMTRRDEFYLIRGITFQPRASDGTTIVVGQEQDVLRAIAGTDEVPMRGVDLDP